MGKRTTGSVSVSGEPPNQAEKVYMLCKNGEWVEVLELITSQPSIAVQTLTMSNHIPTTILHQAITAKGNIQQRADVMTTILHQTPAAAQCRNGFGSLPLHVITQRNTKLDAKTKEGLLRELLRVYPAATVQRGGMGDRNPVHILFTDYYTMPITKLFLQHGGAKACSMKDKKGFLPAHVACTRHCSPEKLRLLLEVYPDALWERTRAGDTLLSLAKSNISKSHPNLGLIKELEWRMKGGPFLPTLGSRRLPSITRARQETAAVEVTPTYQQRTVVVPNNVEHMPTMEPTRKRKGAIATKRTKKRRKQQKVETVAPTSEEPELLDQDGEDSSIDPAAHLLLHFSKNAHVAV